MSSSSSTIHYTNFARNHAQLAPPGYQPSSERHHGSSRSLVPETNNDHDHTNDATNPNDKLTRAESDEASTITTTSSLSKQPNHPSRVVVVDPVQWINRRGLGHGVFVCAMCGAAHKLLGTDTAQVHSVQDGAAWNLHNVQQLNAHGNAHSRRVLERFVPPQYWTRVHHGGRLRSTDSIAERLIFVRAKYQALAFCLPSPTHGATWTEEAWTRLLTHHHHYGWNNYFQLQSVSKSLPTAPTPSLTKASSSSSSLSSKSKRKKSKRSKSQQQPQLYYTLTDLTLYDPHRERSLPLPVDDTRSSIVSSSSHPHGFTSEATTTGGAILPNRLVDFFCVVSAGTTVDPKQHAAAPWNTTTTTTPVGGTTNANLNTVPEDVLLVPKVTNCYPAPTTYTDMEFPEHVGYFCFPEGCRPSRTALSPTFFTLVLTCSDGRRLYGGALQLHDHNNTVEVSSLQQPQQPQQSSSPTATTGPPQSSSSSSTEPSDIVYLPKCLVLLSHYPFFDLWRKFLLQIYRIALVEAPLPLERFIANFVSEVPLPPPGQWSVRYGLTAHEIWTIQRPPDNELPLADFSFQPLFQTLSIPNVLVVLACLLQETRLVLLSKHYATLTPVAEALLSLLFPLHWVRVCVCIVEESSLSFHEGEKSTCLSCFFACLSAILFYSSYSARNVHSHHAVFHVGHFGCAHAVSGGVAFAVSSTGSS